MKKKIISVLLTMVVIAVILATYKFGEYRGEQHVWDFTEEHQAQANLKLLHALRTNSTDKVKSLIENDLWESVLPIYRSTDDSLYNRDKTLSAIASYFQHDPIMTAKLENISEEQVIALADKELPTNTDLPSYMQDSLKESGHLIYKQHLEMTKQTRAILKEYLNNQNSNCPMENH